jgi:hypothetical protein
VSVTWKINIKVDMGAAYGRWRLGSGGELIVVAGRRWPQRRAPVDAA